MATKRLYDKTVIQGAKTKDLAPLPRTYRGFSTISADSENFSLYDFSLIKQDILNHFHIRKGEKLSDPNFGTIIWDVIFEPLTEDIQNLIIQDVEEIINYDPRVEAEEIVVTAYESGIQIECELTYLPYNISENLRLRFDQDNGIIG